MFAANLASFILSHKNDPSAETGMPDKQFTSPAIFIWKDGRFYKADNRQSFVHTS